MFTTSALAQTATGAPGAGDFIGMIVPLVAIMGVFYFLMIRPQHIQRKEQAARVAALQTGDKVVTTSGIHGLVHNVKDHTVVIKVAEGTMIEFDKLAVAIVHKKDSAK